MVVNYWIKVANYCFPVAQNQYPASIIQTQNPEHLTQKAKT